ncbi:hypothetical protein K438DRAFT_1819425 [Mycena galopus ATCC 62051]|nr:hypothetical protein K438DRAFT_1819425 [Mycena galopus ATCC 62051]
MCKHSSFCFFRIPTFGPEWLAVPNLVFLGLYFVIAKLYANSLFITLNTRKNLFPEDSSQHPIMFLESRPNFVVGQHLAASQAQTVFSPFYSILADTYMPRILLL